MTTTPGPLGQRTAAEIRAELARQKRSGRWLAEQIGAPTGTVARWIGGETSPPLDALYAMCRALGINVADIVSAALRDGDVEPVINIRSRRDPRAGSAQGGGASDNSQGAGRDTHRYESVAA